MYSRLRSASTISLNVFFALLLLISTESQAGVFHWQSQNSRCEYLTYRFEAITNTNVGSYEGLPVEVKMLGSGYNLFLDGTYTSIPGSPYTQKQIITQKAYKWYLGAWATGGQQSFTTAPLYAGSQAYVAEVQGYIGAEDPTLAGPTASPEDGTIEACLALNPPDPCQDEWDLAVVTCGDPEFVAYDNLETCEWHCNTCDDAYEDAQEECPYGFIFDNRTCLYRCKDCMDAQDECEELCVDHGGVMLKSCEGNAQDGFDTVCVCQDAFEPELLEEGTTPPATPDDQTPAADPTLPDPDTSDPWSQAIKQNLDKIVEQGNNRKDQLANIADNIKKTVDNQVAGDKNITDAIREGNKDLDRIADKLDQQKTDAQGPDVPSFDSSVGESQEWSEYDDGETLGQTRAGSFQSDLSTLLGENPSPISGVLTASGDPCLTGNVTIHNNSKAVSICFNKPWMEQGYSIMKLIFIGLGYLQAALLVMKAIKL